MDSLGKRNREIMGQLCEKVARLICQREGWYILPLSNFNNGGATLFSGIKNKIISLDDLQIKQGISRFVDVKGKSRPTRFQKAKGKPFQHGVPKKNFDDYIKAQKISGIPGFIIVVEAFSRKWLLASLDDLSKNIHHILYMDGELHVFWNRTVFQEFLIPKDINVPEPLPPEAERTLQDIENKKYDTLKKFRQLNFTNAIEVRDAKEQSTAIKGGETDG